MDFNEFILNLEIGSKERVDECVEVIKSNSNAYKNMSHLQVHDLVKYSIKKYRSEVAMLLLNDYPPSLLVSLKDCINDAIVKCNNEDKSNHLNKILDSIFINIKKNKFPQYIISDWIILSLSADKDLKVLDNLLINTNKEVKMDAVFYIANSYYSYIVMNEYSELIFLNEKIEKSIADKGLDKILKNLLDNQSDLKYLAKRCSHYTYGDGILNFINEKVINLNKNDLKQKITPLNVILNKKKI